MSTPLLLSAALIFWGWQTGLLPLAVLLAVILESHRLFKVRWEIAPTSWNHIGDLCTILLLGIVAVGFLQDKARIVFNIGMLLPLILYPLIITQFYSVSGRVELSSISIIARRQRALAMEPPATINFTYPYFLAALLAAGMGNRTDGSYYIGIVLLGLWAIYPLRSRAFPRSVCIVLLLIVATAGYFEHVGLYRLQEKLIELAVSLYENNNFPVRTSTAIGDIGKLKRSNTILFRVETQDTGGQLLLHEASFNAFRYSNWLAVDAERRAVDTWDDNGKWQVRLGPEYTPSASLRIHTKTKAEMLLKLPAGTFRIDQLPSAELHTNELGAALLVDPQFGLAAYKVSYAPEASLEAPPNDWDLDIPDIEYPAVRQVIRELKLDEMDPDRIPDKLRDYFQNEFGYSLLLEGRGERRTPIAHFLLDRKAGHCEYFATATVLILRACDIPARYAVGYAASEFSPMENKLIVRKRHAHAWTRVFLDGRWQDLDTTSPNWIDIENANRPPFQFLSDLGAFIAFKLSQFRWSDKNYMEKTAAVLISMLVLMMAIRLRKQGRTGRRRTGVRQKKTGNKPAVVSGIQQLERLLSDRGYPRNPGEPLMHWARRMELAAPVLLDYAELHAIIQWHYRQRFAAGSARTDQDAPEGLQRVGKMIRTLEASRTP